MLCIWWNFEGVTQWEFVPNGRAVNAHLYSQQLERVHEILRRRCPALVNRNRVLLQHDNARPLTARNTMIKLRNWEESNCYHTQHTALILHLQITMFRSMAHFLRGRNLIKGTGTPHILSRV